MSGIVIFGDEVDQRSLEQLERCLDGYPDARGVLCADHHLGYSMPIGGVVAYRDEVSPSAVGYDIGCGNLAIETTLKFADIGETALPGVMDEIVRRISFGVGRVNNEPVDHGVLDRIRDADCTFQRSLLDLAASQLGTVGAGNHYVDLLVDEDNTLWVACHFGSRGFGHKTATHFFNLAGAKDDIDAPPTVFPVDSTIGQDYLAAMELAGDYAYVGREIVVERVLEILGCGAAYTVANHHNYAWLEEHGGDTYYVHRKGSTPAYPMRPAFVGATMGEPSVILTGLPGERSEAALYSTAHGAGRAMSRTQAAGKRNRKSGKLIRPGLVDWNEEQDKLKRKGIVIRGGDADEAPPAYKRLHEVLAAHEGTIAVVRVLYPIGVAMAPRGTRDPYKD